MIPTPFFRLLHTPIDAKGDALAAEIAALNTTGRAENAFLLDPAAFAQIPGSPFAYWASLSVRETFVTFPRFGSEDRRATKGLASTDDFQFLRLFWEVAPTNDGWKHFAKGGAYSPYYADIHLIVDWVEDAKHLKDYLDVKITGQLGTGGWSRWINAVPFYFRPGLTWPLRTQRGLNVRALPAGCIFGHKGPAAFSNNDTTPELLALLAIINSTSFRALVNMQMAFGSYEVGVIQRTPIPDLADQAAVHTLATIAYEAHDLQRDRDRTDETTHAFGLPGLVQERAAGSLTQASQALDRQEQARYSRLAAIQAEIDDIVMKLYGLTIDDLGGTVDERPMTNTDAEEPFVIRPSSIVDEQDDEQEEIALPENLPRRVADLLQWCVGAAFGRWDVRMALDPTLLPALQGPFDPLPRCAPGALIGVDGLPPQSAEDIAPEAWLRGRENVLDLRFTIDDLRLEDAQSSIVNQQSSIPPSLIAWDGILVDDPTHPSDIVARVREVLGLLWGPRAGAIEQEACAILGFPDLRSYFRDPRKGFFAFHIKRYSKSRRRAPIYWLLQSERRNYGIWLYYHRLRRYSLYEAGRTYADAKVRLEEGRLEELRQALTVLQGASRRRREQEIERQQKLAAEVTAFRNTLDQVALLDIPPDPNDGVVLGIAPLHKLVPWPEAARYWQQLVAGDFGWSTMSQQMQRKRLTIDD